MNDSTQKVARIVAEAKKAGTPLTVEQIGAETGLLDAEVRTILRSLKPEDPFAAARARLNAHLDAAGPGVAPAARRALAALDKFEQAVAADADKAKIRAELAKAQAEVKRLKAKLGQTATAPPDGRRVPCPHCDYSTPTEQGMRIHLGKAHRAAA